MIIPNTLKDRLEAGDLALGALARLAYPATVEAMGYAGLDWVLIDMEHGSIDLQTCEVMCMYGRALGVTPVVRVHALDDALIGRVLDCGAMGVMVPRVKTVEDVEATVRACYYAPRGNRGAGAWRGLEFGAIPGREYYRAANDHVVVVLNIEEPEAIDNIFDIASVDGVHVLSLGPNDLSQAYGVHGDYEHPTMKTAGTRLREAANATGKAAGIGFGVGTAEQVSAAVEQGYQSILIGTDVMYLRRALGDVVGGVRRKPAPEQR